MRVALIASPFISVPPAGYGGTELFIANLAEALIRLGVDADGYANGESRVKANLRSRYPRQDWPLSSETSGLTKELDHTAWAVEDAEAACEVIHVSSALAVPFSRFSSRSFVCTIHHPCEAAITDLYERHSAVAYAAISRRQASLHPTLHPRVIHHGLARRVHKSGVSTQPDPGQFRRPSASPFARRDRRYGILGHCSSGWSQGCSTRQSGVMMRGREFIGERWSGGENLSARSLL
jgi:hypothetical protein